MTKRVMVVDDVADIRQTVSMVLEFAGFEVLTAESGRKCIEELEKGFKGVILMDLMMPELDGWGTIREIVARGLKDGVIISVLTAKGELEADFSELDEIQNIISLFQKPFKADELVEFITECCELLGEPEETVAS